FFDLVAGQIAAAIANARAFEAENQRAAALAELDRAKGAFFSNVSHEFSTPLTIMLSPFSELIATSDEKLSLREQQTWEVAKQQVSNILETISDGFIAFDRDWRFTYINQEAAKLLQKSPEELQGLTLWEDVFQCSIGSTFERELRRAVAEQVTIKFEKFLPQRNIWLAVRAYPSSAGVCIYLCDITEAKRNDMLRRENEQRLQESQRLLQQITDTIPGILYIYDLVENRNVYVNQQISALLGYTAEQIEAMGETLFPQLVHPEDLAKFPDHIQRFHSLPDGEVLESEYRMRSLDGEWYWFSGREIVFNRNTDGSARQVLGTAYDITKRKQAEADLRLQTERFELAAAAVNCLIYDWNIETDLVERTDGLTRIFGYLPEEAEPTRDWWTRLIHPEDLTSAKEQLFAQLANQNRYKVEYRVRCKNNQYLYVIDQGFVIKDSAG
ncbi:MAG TPA: PAS domain-containing protein, partial [Phormidium sp.]